MNDKACENDWLMYRYIERMCMRVYLLETLEYFMQGMGVQLNSILCVFSDNQDVADGDWPELENFEGVCFYCEYADSPFRATYQVFFDNLKKAIEERADSYDVEYRSKIDKYMEKFRLRYKLK